MFHNIEKSGFRRGEYTGYGLNKVWHIRKDGCGGWEAVPQGNDPRMYCEDRIRAPRLSALSVILEHGKIATR